MKRKNKNFLYGVCYYPEAWDPSRHESDLDRIAACGFNFIRIGEGAWSYWEPSEGNFQFALFDRVLELCRARNIQVILGTPTYTCPAWVAHTYPQVLRWDFQRIPMKHGSRRNLNYTAPKMLELSDRICTALADHFKDHPQVIGWQLDNEFNCHMDVSYAPTDTLAFQKWCQAKYKTLEKLNDSWGTTFWSQTYSAWDQIDLPHPSATFLNPSLLLDESRFISDMVVQFARRQAKILRMTNKEWFITHNGLFGNVDGPKLVAELDFFSHDQYPLFYPNWPSYAQNLVQTRSLSFPYGILEQQSGPGGQMSYFHRTPLPGEMRLWAWESIVHGANLLGFFRWRTCPYGSEQHWHGLLDAHDRDNRRLAEAKQLGEEVKRLPSDFFEAAPIPWVAVLRDFDNEINDGRINTYIGAARGEHKRWVQELLRQHVPTDEAWSTSDFSRYRMLIAPHLKITDDALVAKLTAFVKAGGKLVLCAQSGSKDRNCHIVEQTAPGPLAELAGIEVEDWTVLPEKESRTAAFPNDIPFEFLTFVERLRLNGAQAIAHWKTDDALLGESPAITMNEVGSGMVIYIAGYASEIAIKALCNMLISLPDMGKPFDAPAEVEVLIRGIRGTRFLCLLNHSRTSQTVPNVPAGMDLLAGKTISSGPLDLSPFEIKIIERTP